jgi:hypothetical protein
MKNRRGSSISGGKVALIAKIFGAQNLAPARPPKNSPLSFPRKKASSSIYFYNMEVGKMRSDYYKNVTRLFSIEDSYEQDETAFAFWPYRRFFNLAFAHGDGWQKRFRRRAGAGKTPGALAAGIPPA